MLLRPKHTWSVMPACDQHSHQIQHQHQYPDPPVVLCLVLRRLPLSRSSPLSSRQWQK
jgi:hypothetical protein